MTRFDPPSSILVTGATSGLGEALAAAYAQPGVHLALTGRNRERLREITDHCLMAGAEVSDAALDVTDAPAMARWIDTVNQKRPLDLLIANAGVSARTSGQSHAGRQTQAILSANLAGVVNTVLPAIPHMQGHGKGQIAIVSSLAGFLGVPGASAYSASKAAVRIWGEGLRSELRRDGIAVTVICPGFIDTPMTADTSAWKPFVMDVDNAAKLIVNRLRSGPARIAFPWSLYWAIRTIGMLPTGVSSRLVAKAVLKPE